MQMMARTRLSFLLAMVMAFGMVPAQAIAEALDETVAMREQSSGIESVTQAVNDMAAQLDGNGPTEKVMALYAILAGVPIAESTTVEDEDIATVAALHGEPSTSASVSHAYALVATQAGISTVEVEGSDGSSWCMVKTEDGWRHVNPSVATSAEDSSWLLLTDDQVLQLNPNLTSWTLKDGSEAPKAAETADSQFVETKDGEEIAVSQSTNADPEHQGTDRALDQNASGNDTDKGDNQSDNKGLLAQSADVTSEGDISKASVTIENQGYTGEALEPEPVVVLSGKTLDRNTDYDVQYANNTDVGTAEVTILGKGAYTGTKQSEFKIVAPSVSYRVHVQTFGDQDEKKDGETAGTSGMSKRLEAIWINLGSDFPVSGGIEYSTHVQTYGWQNWVGQGALSGTQGESKRLEAIRIKLTGDMEKAYSVYYRVHAQHIGWMAWAKDGEDAGTSGFSWRLEAIQVMIVPKKAPAPSAEGSAVDFPYLTNPGLTYHTHVQNYGWMEWVENGALSGTQGESKRLEGIELKLGSESIQGGIQYRTHVQTYGWQDFVADGAMSGTSGESKRLEAIEIQLTGEVSEYFDVWYRTHVQTFGWLGWTKNGAQSGTAGLSKRMEAIQVELVPKDGAAPGSTKDSFVSMSNSPLVVYTAYSPNYDKGRNHTIDTITPHYMGGNGTVEACGAIFAPVSRQASSNYAIGSDGRVALYVDEADRAWTSGSSANDNRAITIECANLDDGSLTNSAWSSLVDLCADICQRNGKKHLVYRGSADYMGLGDDEMLLTMHKWFQATDCPGPWLSYQFDRLASEVNTKLTFG